MMRQRTEYKSPYAAAVWSMVLPGFGQLYNKDYIIGLVLLGFEFLINLYSNLNLALVYSFTGDFVHAHSVINYRWGMFYPSLYAFSIWQAFNAAKAHNDRFLDSVPVKKTHLTGFFIGMVVGMDFGLFWHDFAFLNQYRVLTILDMPVFSGLIFGLLLGTLGNFIEKTIFRKKKAAQTAKRRVIIHHWNLIHYQGLVPCDNYVLLFEACVGVVNFIIIWS
jgi:hypothetical protein